MSLEGKCCWEIDYSECLRGFDGENRCYVLFVRNCLSFREGKREMDNVRLTFAVQEDDEL